MDFLLDLKNEKVSVPDGHIGVPVFFMQSDGMKLGDTLTVEFDGYEKSFIIGKFIRDSHFGSVMMTPKRFVLSEQDYKEMESKDSSEIFIFSYLLKNEDLLVDFVRDFQESRMPQNDFSVDSSLFYLTYAAADGIIIGLVTLCSILLILISLLTLRYTILSTIEDDFREIGVMKAVGFQLADIIKLYLSKYFYLTMIACVIGFLLGQLMQSALSENLLLYMGSPDNSNWGGLISLIAVCLILIIILVFCLLTLRRIGKMSVIDAIRMGNTGETYKESKHFSLSRRRHMNVNIFVGLKDFLRKIKAYILLLFVFSLCTFICIFPFHVKNTFSEPESLKYFGFITCDITVMPQVTGIGKELAAAKSYISNDSEVLEHSVYYEEYLHIKTDGSETQKIRATMGDHTMFPSEYSSGSAPILENEIALSYLAAKDLGKEVGNSIILLRNGEEKNMIITGIYPDMSNGARSVKACFKSNPENAFYWKICLNTKGDPEKKSEEYKNNIEKIDAATLDSASGQFMDAIVSQLNHVGFLLLIIAMLVSMLITAMFIKMLIAKETPQIAIMKSLGFTVKQIRIQYFTRIGIILLISMTGGILAVNTLGAQIMSAVTSSMGAGSIDVVVKPMEVYFAYPLILLSVVCITILFSCGAVRKILISQINAE